MNVFDVLLERGFIATEEDGTPKQVTDMKVREVLGQDNISCYIGFDPTASSLHVGSLVQIMVLAHMQRAGHRPIAVVGGGTAMVGDPSGKSEMRKMLTQEDINNNMLGLKKHLSRFIEFSEDKAMIANNADWLSPINYIEFLRDYGVHFSVNRMLAAESVKLRLEKEQGLSFLEFNYMLLQAFDFLHLKQNHDCVLQMGGDDQWGNICAGIDLIRRVERKSAYGITFPLITTASGAKMGKTEQGAVWLDSELFSPLDYYQFWRNVDDRDVKKFLGIFTFLPMEQVNELGQLQGKDINKAKKILAFEATKLNHGEQAAKTAQETVEKIWSGDKKGVDLPTLTVLSSELEEGILATELFHKLDLVPSKSEAKRLIKKGGASINDERIQAFDFKVTSADLQDGEILLRAGRKRYAKVVVKS
ncbi:tyrosine--tRNA ligase [Candidatus Uabimicrobium sp. HlEnr_7]|uniref:tyrosine--tRNA ligase n=1 Tax=Candidatus Uabimicrobium helgolandensis TaxID=3095367 RepID=UPI003558239F